MKDKLNSLQDRIDSLDRLVGMQLEDRESTFEQLEVIRAAINALPGKDEVHELRRELRELAKFLDVEFEHNSIRVVKRKGE